MLAALLRGELPRLCQLPDGRLTPDAGPPAVLVCGSFNPLHDGHRRLAEVAARRLGRPAAFEIGAVNADKPPLTEADVRRRLRQFEWLAPVWLTAAPTFVGKANLFPGTTFVLGADTAERVVQPRYYGGCDAMLEAFIAIRTAGCRFLVAGRSYAGAAFVGLDALPVPRDVADVFDAIPEAEFRADISSTALRAQ